MSSFTIDLDGLTALLTDFVQSFLTAIVSFLAGLLL